MVQIDDEPEHPDPLVEEQKNKLREELMGLESLFNSAGHALLFKVWDGVWNKDTWEERSAELGDRLRKSELLTKVVKNVAAGLK